MPLGAARITLLAKTQVTAVAEVIRNKAGITAFNGAQIDTAQSKFGGSSAYFDGVDDYIRVYDPTESTVFGTSDFTLEFWWKKNTTNVTEQLAANRTGYTTGNWYIQFDHTTDKIQWGVQGGAAQRSTSTYDDTNWHHFALTRNSGDFTLYIDGTVQGTYNGTSFVWGRSADAFVDFGRIVSGYGNVWMDEIRYSDTVRYTSAFTPHTTPHINDANTLMLIHCDGTDGSTYFEDDNGTGRSRIGLNAINDITYSTTQSKFGGSSAYSLGGTYASTADYLEATLDHSIGTGDFTWEGWLYFTSTSAYHVFSLTDSSLNVGFEIRLDNPAAWRVYEHASGGATFNLILNSSNQQYAYANAWNHFALVRNSGTLTLFVNGNACATTASYTTNISNADVMHVGAGAKSGYASMTGHMNDVRFSDTARYTSNFTPSNTRFVNDTNTLFLGHFEGTDGNNDFVDDNGTGRSQEGVIAYNQTQISTAQSKFGGASAVFDGNNDYLQIAATNGIDDTSTDFTFEGWFRFDINPEAQTLGGGSYIMLATVSSNSYILCQEVGGERTVQVADSGTYMQWEESGGSGWSINTWYHIAVVRISNQYDIYIDGTALPRPATSAKAGGFAGGGAFTIGRFIDSRGSMDGYMDEIRISNIGRYTGNFTPSTTPFVNDANTLLLLHMDGTDASTTFVDDNGVY